MKAQQLYDFRRDVPAVTSEPHRCHIRNWVDSTLGTVLTPERTTSRQIGTDALRRNGMAKAETPRCAGCTSELCDHNTTDVAAGVNESRERCLPGTPCRIVDPFVARSTRRPA